MLHNVVKGSRLGEGCTDYFACLRVCCVKMRWRYFETDLQAASANGAQGFTKVMQLGGDLEPLLILFQKPRSSEGFQIRSAYRKRA